MNRVGGWVGGVGGRRVFCWGTALAIILVCYPNRFQQVAPNSIRLFSSQIQFNPSWQHPSAGGWFAQGQRNASCNHLL